MVTIFAIFFITKLSNYCSLNSKTTLNENFLSFHLKIRDSYIFRCLSISARLSSSSFFCFSSSSFRLLRSRPKMSVMGLFRSDLECDRLWRRSRSLSRLSLDFERDRFLEPCEEDSRPLERERDFLLCLCFLLGEELRLLERGISDKCFCLVYFQVGWG